LIVLSGPLPKDARFSAFGVEAPLAVLPQQVIAVVTAVLFSQYATLFLSLNILTVMLRKILEKEGHESWQFFAAPFDAGTLWSVLITPKSVGYRSSKREIVLALLVIVVAFATVLAHAVILVAAMGVALLSAIHTHSRFLIFLGGAAFAISTVALLAFLVSVLLPMPYRWAGGALPDATTEDRPAT
jgi:hypothetical protein